MPRSDGTAAHDLQTLIRRQLDERSHRGDSAVTRLLTEIHRRHDQRVAAVLLYGSYLRGKRDTLLDFYVLFSEFDGALSTLESWGNRALPPNVYYLSLPEQSGEPAVRAKYATMTVAQFERAMDDFHSYFWSRFTQPAGLVEARDDATRARVVAALARAVHRFCREVAPMVTASGRTCSCAEFWQRGLALTYASELRSENPRGVAELYRLDHGHFDAILAAYAREPGAVVTAAAECRYVGHAGTGAAHARRRWRLRRLQGKLLSVLRLVKAAKTFDDPLDYLLWKIERHSGIYIAPTERQRRHPLIFAWGLLWRLYRRGAFR